ncbi:MAG: NifU family protein [Spirochaetia bacterium]|jgi:Fe-S cluster biogenesis protein NfuA|nr:NifU family protein [Spirochaetia bacterium]
MEEKVVEAIEAIRPSLQNDGGDVTFVKMEGKTVFVELVGSCAGCPLSQMTLKGGIERYLKEKVDPEIIVENINMM